MDSVRSRCLPSRRTASVTLTPMVEVVTVASGTGHQWWLMAAAGDRGRSWKAAMVEPANRERRRRTKEEEGGRDHSRGIFDWRALVEPPGDAVLVVG